MGCWNETCMLTHLPILSGDKATAIFIATNHNGTGHCHANGVFQPISLPITGEYDDYGRLENIKQNNSALKVLFETEFFHMERNGCRHTPIKHQGNTGEWESSVIKLMHHARHGELFIKDKHMANGYSTVYLSLVLNEFMDFAVAAMTGRLPNNFYEDITYRIQLAENLHDMIRKQHINADNLKQLALLDTFMDNQRISWHPTCGSGSQDALYEPFQKEFYEKMATYARNM